MKKPITLAIFALACGLGLLAWAQPGKQASPGHYLFAWAGDLALKGNDFLAVIDADPKSPSYGRLVAAHATDQPTKLAHHTEYTMPASGMLFANDHDAGRTFIFNLQDPLHPRIAASFGDMDGYMHPHSFLRLPNGHVLATFQHAHSSMGEGPGKTGGLVEIDDQGKVVRSVSSADPAFKDYLLTPYSLIVLPELDRVISTDSGMDDADIFRGLSYQMWRLSDLKLLKTLDFDPGTNRFAHISPEEPRLGPDGSIYVQTVACGLERIAGIERDQPKAELVYTFPGGWCGVPTIVGHYLIQSVPVTNGLIVLDLSNPRKPVEVSRLKLSADYFPHWTGWDPKMQRLVVTPGSSGRDHRLYLVTLNQTTGALALDTAFRDQDGKPGFNFADRTWSMIGPGPGQKTTWKGSGLPHGAVFSR